MTQQLSPTQVRTFTFEIEGRASDDGIPIVVSSDAPVEMPDAVEILVHSAESIDLQRAPLPIIATHASGQVNVGVIDSLSSSDGKLRGVARFGSRPEAAGYKADVIAKIINHVSVGYRRITAKYREDGVLVTSRWMPTHAALVAEPADINAGFYRSQEPAFELIPSDQVSQPPVSQPAAPAVFERKATMADNQAAAGENAEDIVTQTRAASQGNPAQARSGPDAIQMEADRRQGIVNLCVANKFEDGMRQHWISSGLSMIKISEDMMAILQKRSETNPTSKAQLGLTEGDTKRYSLMAAVRACADKNWSDAGFELECSREIAKRLNVVTDVNKFYVPFEVQGRGLRASSGSMVTHDQRRQLGSYQRDLTVGTTTAGGFLVGTENMTFIELLRNRSVAYRMGARRLAGLVGNVTIPRQTGAATAVWLANEASTATESQQTLGQLSLSPKTVGAYTEISRLLMLQASPDAESMVTSDLAAVCALAIDVGALRGSGASGEPTGIVNTAGIGSVSGTSIGYAGVLEFQTDVATANIMPVSGGYATTPAVAALLMQRVKFTSTASPLWEGNVWDGTMAGFGAMSTNQMTAASMLFGDWAQVVIAEWGMLQVEVNPYANFQAGIIGVRAMVSIDVGLRYAAAFSLATTIT